MPRARSSTGVFGAVGQRHPLFHDDIYRAKTCPALLDSLNVKGLKLAEYIAAGDDEYKNENPAEA